MYLIGTAVGAGLVILAFLSRREEGKLLERMSVYLYKKGCIYRIPMLNAHHVQRDLESLYPGQSGLFLQGGYYRKKIQLLLSVLCVGTLLGVLARICSDMGSSLTEQGELLRPARGQGTQQVELQVRMQGEEPGVISVQVPERRLTRQEAQELYEEFWEAWKRETLGDNPSWREVSFSLTPVEELEGYPFAVSWKSSDYEVLGGSGAVYEPQTSTTVTLTVESRYLDLCWQEELEILVVPRTLEGAELLAARAWDAYCLAQEEAADRDRIRLPEKLGENALEWREIRENHSAVLMLMTVVTAAAVFLFQDRDLHQQVLKRRERMKENYPVMLSKLILYLGAGMTIRGAFQKIALDYHARQEGVQRSLYEPLYEEMLYACNRLQAGVSESRTLELWAARTGLQDCAKLSALLVQNLKKGNTALLTRLREEGDRALQEELNLHRKKGEEAGTALLVPMIMMMAIVMVLVMVPAFQSFGI